AGASRRSPAVLSSNRRPLRQAGAAAMSTRPAPAPFGALLRQYRRAAGLTQEELAERAHLSWRAIQDLERGVRQTPRAGTQELLAEALALSPEQRAALADAARRTASPPAAPALPPAVPAPEVGGALPVPTTPLIGRDNEVAAVTALLRRPEGRLLTVSGPGG